MERFYFSIGRYGRPRGKREFVEVGIDMKKLIAYGLHNFGPLRLMERWARSHALRSGTLSTGRPGWRRVDTPRFAILCYHRIGTGGVPIYSGLPMQVFEAQMRFLRKNYRLISLSDLLQELPNPMSCEPAVAVTFDDGYRDLFQQAYPILLKYHVPATVYLTVGAIETNKVSWYDKIFLALLVAPGNVFEWTLDRRRRIPIRSRPERLEAAVQIITWMRTLPDTVRREQCAILENHVRMPQADLSDRMLTWEQVRIMRQGGVSFGAHTMNHPVVSRLTALELDKELLESKKILEDRIQDSVADFAYPFGKTDEISVEAERVLASGAYRSAVTTEHGLNVPGTNPYRLLRVSICEERSLSMFAFQLNRLFVQGEYDHALPLSVDSNSHPKQHAEVSFMAAQKD
jgi:peptidoglycan/xylan/chitin deacetylase (PgdA/CDA1 family)